MVTGAGLTLVRVPLQTVAFVPVHSFPVLMVILISLIAPLNAPVPVIHSLLTPVATGANTTISSAWVPVRICVQSTHHYSIGTGTGFPYHRYRYQSQVY
jgi:hypothetical protein